MRVVLLEISPFGMLQKKNTSTGIYKERVKNRAHWVKALCKRDFAIVQDVCAVPLCCRASGTRKLPYAVNRIVVVER